MRRRDLKGAPMSADLYIRMVRDKPRRKGQPPELPRLPRPPRTKQRDGDAMSADLYIRMVRDKPRRKGQPPGKWEPFLSGPPQRYVSPKEAIEAQGYGIDVWNRRERRQHALFRIPAAAMELIYPGAAAKRAAKEPGA